MEVHLAEQIKENTQAQTAADWVRKCVHCGFCNATCPTYQLLGDEADGPRGRIYLIKQMLENGKANERSRLHLDRCLLCRNCETTCPSGVEYGRLLEAGKQVHETLAPRGRWQQLQRKALTAALLKPRPLKRLVALAQLVRPLLSNGIEQQLPNKSASLATPTSTHPRKVLLLKGCVQSTLSPVTNAAAIRVLHQLGITAVESPTGCCGALRYHTTSHADGLIDIKRLIDLWWPCIEEGVEAIIFTASGCGVTIKDYGELLKGDKDYASKAQKISALAKDVSQIVAAEIGQNPQALSKIKPYQVAFHAPCTLQHGLKLDGVVEKILSTVGHALLPIEDKHLCCGSAGSYSIFQRKISDKLKYNKLDNLQALSPEVIATANIGCQQQLNSGSDTRVVHWIELLDTEFTK